MPSYNKVVLIGHLTRDIEIRTLPTGTVVGESSIAVNERYKDSNGDKKEEVSFIDILMWSKTAEIMEKYLKKGDAVLVEGKIKQDRWKNAEGENRSKIRVVVKEFTFMPKSGTSAEQDDKPSDEEVLGATPF